MGVLAVHPGDLHLRAAYLGPLNAPHAMEDGYDPAKLVTPSVIALDAGGALLGHAALMAGVIPRAERVLWRYRRAALGRREVVAHDLAQRGLTSDAFVSVALRRLAWEAAAFATAHPQLAVVVPGDLPAAARARLVALAAACTAADVAAIDEDDALFATLPGADDGAWLIASWDDDALRLRVAMRGDVRFEPVFPIEIEEAGLLRLRARWLGRWQADAAALAPGAAAFGDGESYEFERIWQDIWECLDEQRAAAGPWPLVRQSALLPLGLHLPAVREALHAHAAVAAEQLAGLRATLATRAEAVRGVVVVGSPALRDALAAPIAARLQLTSAQMVHRGADAYARGAALLAGAGAGRSTLQIDRAPHGLSVLGLGDDGRPVMRPLLEAGTALPASVAFTLVADRDAQRDIMVTLTGGDAPSASAQRFIFGPLAGNGMQRVTVSVEWSSDGTLAVSAADRETGTPIPCADCSELAGEVALAGPAHLRPLFGG
jgi:hypothetical protein